MSHSKRKQLVFTVKDRCRVCYTCVRECPVKAIKIINGQAEVINERCIGCGNCTIVCSQGAKVFLKT
ncbi:MAG: 4Fe-4S binding protein, partial [Bacteroidota bacterium]